MQMKARMRANEYVGEGEGARVSGHKGEWVRGRGQEGAQVKARAQGRVGTKVSGCEGKGKRVCR